MLTDVEFEAYLQPLDTNQVECIRAIRGIIVEISPDLVEEVDTGKWFGGLLTYHTEDKLFGFALGPLSNGFTTFHMMPYYGSKVLQERHGVALKKLLSGKSCIKLKTPDQIPKEALRDIVGCMPEMVKAMFASGRMKKTGK